MNEALLNVLHTDLSLLFEQKIKALAEPIVTQTLGTINATLNTDFVEYCQEIGATPDTDWYMVSRGGDALNFYYPNHDVIPTHDWDIGLVSVPSWSDIPQEMFNFLLNQSDRAIDDIVYELNQWFILCVNKEKLFPVHLGTAMFTLVAAPEEYRTQGPFYPLYAKNRLAGVLFDYKIEYKDSEGNTVNYTTFSASSLLDLYILDEVQDGVVAPSRVTEDQLGTDTDPGVEWLRRHGDVRVQQETDREIDNSPSWDEKMNLAYMQQQSKHYPDQLVEMLQKYLLDGSVIYQNRFDMLVQDPTSKMYYVAPGDLLTDTMRMIFQSVYDIDIATNKLDKYIVKYTKLLIVINDMMDLCPIGKNGVSACERINRFLLERDTNILDCNGTPIPAKKFPKWRKGMRKEFEKFFTSKCLNLMFDHITSKKICEILAVLSTTTEPNAVTFIDRLTKNLVIKEDDEDQDSDRFLPMSAKEQIDSDTEEDTDEDDTEEEDTDEDHDTDKLDGSPGYAVSSRYL